MGSIYKITEKNEKRWKNLDKLIARKYSASHMSNSKWVKLLTLCSSFSDSVPSMNYKMVYDDVVFESFTESDVADIEVLWFREPTIYKEIEWVEFPIISNKKYGFTAQKLTNLKNAIEAGGNFPVTLLESGLRIVAYDRV